MDATAVALLSALGALNVFLLGLLLALITATRNSVDKTNEYYQEEVKGIRDALAEKVSYDNCDRRMEKCTNDIKERIRHDK